MNRPALFFTLMVPLVFLPSPIPAREAAQKLKPCGQARTA
jgi:hypothetical protein